MNPHLSASTKSSQTILTLCCGPASVSFPVWNTLRSSSLTLIPVNSVQDAVAQDPALLLLDAVLLTDASWDVWRAALPNTIFLSESRCLVDSDLILNDGLPFESTRKIVQMACENWLAKKRAREYEQLLSVTTGHLEKFTSIGIALASENDLATLLRKILTEGQNISACDGASLFLLDDKNRKITFKLTQNDSIDFPFKESQFELDSSSIAGYVALHKSTLNIEDAYRIGSDAPYAFNSSFDHLTGYRTASILTLPALDKRKSVIAVLQFINRKRSRDLRIVPGRPVDDIVVPFDDHTVLLLQALAGQAGVAIENALLHHSIQNLFEGFVEASVMAIEQRDPTTSGHSFRVADLCVALATAVNGCKHGQCKEHFHSEAQLRELRYAALLHDFGKVGVRESVLVKAKKLDQRDIDNIRYRILLAKERLKNKALQKQLQLHRRHMVSEEKILRIETDLELECEQLDSFLEIIIEANEPTIMHADDFTRLNRVAAYSIPFERRHGFSIVSDFEFKMLSIQKGSLSSTERLEIESHVTHTRNFLKLIPWTEELRNIPDIAGAHHEKLNGSGYPLGQSAAEIPFSSKIMTICDIYDALTASDRPYKAAVSCSNALEILKVEAREGAIDGDLVDIFINQQIYSVIEGVDYSTGRTVNQGFSHHVCDFDLHEPG